MKTLLVLLAVTAAAPPAGNRILGEWRGTSLCTNLKLTPSCKDETVRYLFTGPVGGKYRVDAQKLVGKNYQSMGDLEFTYNAAESTWTAPHGGTGRWWFRVRGSRLTGGLTESGQDTTRKVTATRYVTD